MSASAKPFARGCLIAAAPVALLYLPLLVHRSEQPLWAGFSRTYLLFLAGAAAAALVVIGLVGLACRRARGSEPALAFVLSVVALVAACAVVEMVLTYRLRLADAFAQYREWGHERSLMFGFEATPNHRWTNAGATYSTDRFGFRTHTRGPWEAVAGLRIFTLGESSVFGYGLDDDETWPHVLEDMLRSRRSDPSLMVSNPSRTDPTLVPAGRQSYYVLAPVPNLNFGLAWQY